MVQNDLAAFVRCRSNGQVERRLVGDDVLGSASLELPDSKVYLGAGPILTASDHVRIIVHGKGAHGAFPHGRAVHPYRLAGRWSERPSRVSMWRQRRSRRRFE